MSTESIYLENVDRIIICKNLMFEIYSLRKRGDTEVQTHLLKAFLDLVNPGFWAFPEFEFPKTKNA